MGKIKRFLTELLKVSTVRFYFVKSRYKLLKKNLHFYETNSTDIGETTIKHNLGAFDHLSGAFGCGGRMGLLQYPIVPYFRNKKDVKVLIVGCRTEDDIFWMRAYGYYDTKGFDLFSYSKHVLVGDIHETEFEDNTYDVVLLGWMISYTKNPQKVVNECTRILKDGGLLGIGLDHVADQDITGIKPPRVNTLNSTSDIKGLFNDLSYRIIFEYDHYAPADDATAIVVRLDKNLNHKSNVIK